MRLILYSKPGCHLCEGLQEKLEQMETLDYILEVRDILTNEDWFNRYQYQIPVLVIDNDGQEIPVPRLSPRASVTQLEKKLRDILPA
ncbi:glutaredoxin family protein [Spirulina sp. CS-785/01]|uniref:glutaredoxin family protein n=1 Tax=Spirulina sp. CS-785/01 TaxID=3021716 RepID=UPI00232CF00F|nr:glutaredoxin family protein [Spirulina sp. CS-785/01]MDB9314925.1 glutaredoxin family protein [Spirulina sp. CS-785/01]